MPRSPTLALAALALLGLCAGPLACKGEPPGNQSREPATEVDATPSTGDAHPKSQPMHHEGPRAEDLVKIELGVVDDTTRQALTERLGPQSALADAEALLAVHYAIAEHWHIYWTNPGESGLRTRIEVEAKGAKPGEVIYPAPERLVAPGGQVTYGWGESAVLFVPLSELGDSPSLTLETRYLVCRESCIPGKVELEATLGSLPVRDDSATKTMVARVPEPAGDRVEARWAEGQLLIQARAGAELVALFPYASDAALLGDQEHEGTTLVLHYRFQQAPPADLGQGVLEARVDGQPLWLELATAWPAT